MYNRPSSNTLAQLNREMSKRPLAEHVVMGDMNAHHLAWGGAGTKIDDEAEQLLEIIDKHDLELITEEGKATWTRNDQESVIDLTLISSTLTSRLIRCERADDVEYSSDHFPARTVLDIETPIREQEKRRNWNATDYEKLIQKIEEGLQVRDISQADPAQIECQYQTLLDVVQSAIDASTPWANPSV